MSFFERPAVTLYLVRHGQSEANVNKNVYREKPDHMIGLTPLGTSQAAEAGQYMATQFSGTEKAILLRSPYQRARDTEDAIAETMRPHIEERVELPELAEQQYGLFDGVPPDELATTFPEEYSRFILAQKSLGRFWARPPQGEALFDVYQRATTVAHYIRFAHRRATINNFIIVAHGNWLQCFLMAWCNFPYEWIAKSRVPENCEILKVHGQEILGSVFMPTAQTHEAVHGPNGDAK